MSDAPKKGPKHGILSLNIKDKAVLYAAYMPFVQEGGLFIPTAKQYELGDEVFMLLSLMDRAAGVGVQFSPQDNGKARGKIETHLAGSLESERPTHTM